MSKEKRSAGEICQDCSSSKYTSIVGVSKKGKGRYMGTPSQSYRASLAIWDHTVLPATRHK